MIRTAVAGLAGLGSLVLVFFLIPGMWVNNQVNDRDAFVGFAGPLIEDEVFVDAFSAALGETVVAGFALEGSVAELATNGVGSTTKAVASRDGFADAWVETLEATHEAQFGEEGRAVIDVTPVARYVLGEVPAIGPELAPLLQDQLLLMHLGNRDADVIVQRLQYSQAVVWMLMIGAGGLALVAIAGASRRGYALVALGGGLIVIAVCQWLAFSSWLPSRVRGLDAERPLTREFMAVVSEAAADSMSGEFVRFGGIGLVLVAFGLIWVFALPKPKSSA